MDAELASLLGRSGNRSSSQHQLDLTSKLLLAGKKKDENSTCSKFSQSCIKILNLISCILLISTSTYILFQYKSSNNMLKDWTTMALSFYLYFSGILIACAEAEVQIVLMFVPVLKFQFVKGFLQMLFGVILFQEREQSFYFYMSILLQIIGVLNFFGTELCYEANPPLTSSEK